ncbi:hypothetical protein CcrColossus_gp335 [Caulobacter phage CcrColossus]|uniref:Uncharacterized protein n=1 Tax=Caulobacter phage CcrColossus TaxID=1211640 RepID=K4JV16_9CAUD|nr:hypothetical protein CcrColossus_gp335 [Caulobacter phage CcrColossus]AFU88205.1 hypothetical protein CcrColossus_gp335 [Caulobacter phage CcrColossus]
MIQPEPTVEELLAEIKRILEAPDDIDPAVLMSPKMSSIAGVADVEFDERWAREVADLERVATRIVPAPADHTAVEARIDNVIYVRFGGSPY